MPQQKEGQEHFCQIHRVWDFCHYPGKLRRREIDRPYLTDRQKRILTQLHTWLANESRKKPGPDGQHVLRMWGWEVDELKEAIGLCRLSE